jgi:hypothetical protein
MNHKHMYDELHAAVSAKNLSHLADIFTENVIQAGKPASYRFPRESADRRQCLERIHVTPPLTFAADSTVAAILFEQLLHACGRTGDAQVAKELIATMKVQPSNDGCASHVRTTCHECTLRAVRGAGAMSTHTATYGLTYTRHNTLPQWHACRPVGLCCRTCWALLAWDPGIEHCCSYIAHSSTC